MPNYAPARHLFHLRSGRKSAANLSANWAARARFLNASIRVEVPPPLYRGNKKCRSRDGVIAEEEAIKSIPEIEICGTGILNCRRGFLSARAYFFVYRHLRDDAAGISRIHLE